MAARVRRRSTCPSRSSRGGSSSRAARSTASCAAASPDEDGNLERFLVGKVLEAEKHPNADRLQLTKVDVGEGEPRSIVCGAWNFGAGATVAVALPGAVLPNGLDARAPQGARRGLGRDDPRRGRGRPRHRPQRDHAPRRRARAGHAARRRPAARRHGARDRDRLQPARPHVRSTASPARSRPCWTCRLAPMPGGQAPGPVPNDEPVDIRIDDLERCPRYIGRLVPRRRGRRVAARG